MHTPPLLLVRAWLTRQREPEPDACEQRGFSILSPLSSNVLSCRIAGRSHSLVAISQGRGPVPTGFCISSGPMIRSTACLTR